MHFEIILKSFERRFKRPSKCRLKVFKRQGLEQIVREHVEGTLNQFVERLSKYFKSPQKVIRQSFEGIKIVAKPVKII